MQALDNASAPIPIMVPDQAPITARTNVIAARRTNNLLKVA